MFFGIVGAGLNWAGTEIFFTAKDLYRTKEYVQQCRYNALRYQLMAANIKMNRDNQYINTYQENLDNMNRIVDAEFSPIENMNSWRQRVSPTL